MKYKCCVGESTTHPDDSFVIRASSKTNAMAEAVAWVKKEGGPTSDCTYGAVVWVEDMSGHVLAQEDMTIDADGCCM